MHTLEMYLSRKTIVIFLLAATTTAILGPMLVSNPFIGRDDASFHIYNTQLFINELKSGVFYPRLLGNWYGGYGAAIGIGYPPLTYYSTALLAILGIPTLASLKLVIGVVP